MKVGHLCYKNIVVDKKTDSSVLLIDDQMNLHEKEEEVLHRAGSLHKVILLKTAKIVAKKVKVSIIIEVDLLSV